MLTARDELPDKIAGFRSGADDYLTKPFDLPELEVRLEALVARASGRGRDKVLEIADLRLDLSTLEASRGGRSEEHTSELQSLMRISYAVFCLKKKNKKQTTPRRTG